MTQKHPDWKPAETRYDGITPFWTCWGRSLGSLDLRPPADSQGCVLGGSVCFCGLCWNGTPSLPPALQTCFVFGPQEHPLFALPGKKGADCSWTVSYALFPSWPLLFISFLSLVLYECVPIIPSECTITHPIALSLFKNSQNIWMSFSPEKLNFMNNI